MKKRFLLPLLFIFPLSSCQLAGDFFIAGTENGMNHQNEDGSSIPTVDNSVTEEEWNYEINDNNFFYSSGNVTVKEVFTGIDPDTKESVSANLNLLNEKGTIYYAYSTNNNKTREAYIKLGEEFDKEEKVYLNSWLYTYDEDNKEWNLSKASYSPLAVSRTFLFYHLDYNDFSYNQTKNAYIATSLDDEEYGFTRAEVSFSKKKVTKIVLSGSDVNVTIGISDRGSTKVTLPKADLNQLVDMELWDEEINESKYLYPDENVTIEETIVINGETSEEATQTTIKFENDSGKIKLSSISSREVQPEYVQVSSNYDEKSDSYLKSTRYIYDEENKEYTSENFDYSPSSYSLDILQFMNLPFESFSYDKDKKVFVATDLPYQLDNEEGTLDKVEVKFVDLKVSSIHVEAENMTVDIVFSKFGSTSVTLPSVKK